MIYYYWLENGETYDNFDHTMLSSEKEYSQQEFQELCDSLLGDALGRFLKDERKSYNRKDSNRLYYSDVWEYLGWMLTSFHGFQYVRPPVYYEGPSKEEWKKVVKDYTDASTV